MTDVGTENIVKIVVTGCSGYIGAFLVDLLSESGRYAVVGIDRVDAPLATPKCARFVKCDLAAPGVTLEDAAFGNIDAVIHLAAARGDWGISAEEYWRDNLKATENLLHAGWARDVPRWVFMSSVSVYGPAEEPLTEQAPCRPIGPYGESKLASETLFREFIDLSGLKGRVIRPSAVFGPAHPPNTNVYKLIESLRGLAVPIIGGGDNRKTLTYLPNLLDLIIWCLDDMQIGRARYAAYNYVEEPVQTVSELVQTLKAAGITPARQIAVPMSLVLALAYPIYALSKLVGVDLKVTPERVRKFVASTCYDSSQVRRDGFVPRVDLMNALKDTVRWHLSR